MNRTYLRIKEHGNLEANNLSSLIAQWPYCRSFFLKDRAIARNIARPWSTSSIRLSKRKRTVRNTSSLSRMNQDRSPSL